LSNDNLLFAAEIAGLDLNGTKLVTLSACETGTGPGPMSEGHYSLARAFHSAGVRDVLSCTEPLPDASVAALMTPFYQRVAKGDDSARAFREEQQRAIGDDVTGLRQYGFFRLTRAWVKAKE
jgi:CHAT domain-containing protein